MCREELLAIYALSLVPDKTVAFSAPGLIKLMQGAMKLQLLHNKDAVMGIDMTKTLDYMCKMHTEQFYKDNIKDRIK